MLDGRIVSVGTAESLDRSANPRLSLDEAP